MSPEVMLAQEVFVMVKDCAPEQTHENSTRNTRTTLSPFIIHLFWLNASFKSTHLKVEIEVLTNKKGQITTVPSNIYLTQPISIISRFNIFPVNVAQQTE